jgi:hypothetical protein
MAENDPKAPLPVGTTVILVDVRSPLRDQYAAIINGVDPATKLPLVTRFSRTMIGRRDVPAESVGHPVRFDDGTPPAGLEQFRIVSVTGSPEMADVVTTLLARVEESISDGKKALAALSERLSVAEKRLAAVAETIGQPSVTGDAVSNAIKKALHTGIVVPIRGRAPEPAAETHAPAPEPVAEPVAAQQDDPEAFAEPVGAGSKDNNRGKRR